MLLSFSSVLACPSAMPLRRLSATDGAPVADPSEYRSLAGHYNTLFSPAPTCLCGPAGVPLHARPLRAAPCPRQAHSSLRQGPSFYWSLHWHRSCLASHDILKCGLSRVPRLPPLHVGLLCLPRRQLSVLVIQVSEHCLSLQY
jgi:hypothetical protein